VTFSPGGLNKVMLLSINSIEGSDSTVLDFNGIVFDSWLNLIRVRAWN
jgi:hypothetical protein